MSRLSILRRRSESMYAVSSIMEKWDIVFHIYCAHKDSGGLVHWPNGRKRKIVFFFPLLDVKWATEALGHPKAQMLFGVSLILMLNLKFFISLLMVVVVGQLEL